MSALPLEPVPEPEPAAASPWCPGGGQKPAPTDNYALRFVYGGVCPACLSPVGVADNWMTAHHYTREYIRGDG